MKRELLERGWVVSPNNIHALQGCVMYPASGGMKCNPEGTEVQVLSDRIRVFSVRFFGEAYSCRSFHDTVTEAVFDSVEAFLSWCPTVSDPGLPAFMHGRD